MLPIPYFMLALILAFIITPYFIKKLAERGYVVRDYHKPGAKMVPTGGGMIILLAALFSFAINSAFFDVSPINYVLFVIITMFGLFGIIDDMVELRAIFKIVVLYFCSLPLYHYIGSTEVMLPLDINLGLIYPFLIVPIYVLVVANLVNMHSGYNGLASGLSLILLFFFLLKSYIAGNISSVITIIAIAGATLGFFYYEHYPSKIFWGNSGSFSVGAAIGLIIVVQGFLISGFIMLIPHTVNFLMYVYWKVRRIPITKFGDIRENGTIIVPNRLTLKWVLPSYRRLTEKQATYVMYALTVLFSLFGLWIPY